MMKRNEGFTLIELILAISIGTIITAAVLSVLLFGMRINLKTTASVQQVNATNMLTQIVQSVAEESNIAVRDNQIVFLEIDNNGIIVTDSEGNAVIRNVFVSWNGKEILLNNSVFMEDVDHFTAVLSEDNQLLTVTLKTNGKEYTASAYCRLNQGGSTDES